MSTINKASFIVAATAICAMVFLGCSEDQGKKQEKKEVTVQQQAGRDAAENLQKPLEDARKAAMQVEGKNQSMRQMSEGVATDTQETSSSSSETGKQGKKKLEGC